MIALIFFTSFSATFLFLYYLYKYITGTITQKAADSISFSDNILPHLLIIINPIGGKRNSMEIYNQIISPKLDENKINYRTIVTESQYHCTEIIKNANLSMVTGIIAIGGDGHLNQIINSVLQRSDYQTLIDKISFGCIAAGTGNGVAKSLQIIDPLESVKAIIENKTKSINVMNLSKIFSQEETKVEQDKNLNGLLSLTGGFIAVFDKMMEQKFRNIHILGYTCFFPCWFRQLLNALLIPMYLILKNPSYKVNISIIPKNQNEIDNSFWKPHPDKNKSSEGWVNFQGKVTTFALCALPYIASDICIAPHMFESNMQMVMDLMILKPVTRLELLIFFMKAEKGQHTKSPCVNYVSVENFELMINDNQTIMFDGEEIETRTDSDALKKLTHIRCNVSEQIKMFSQID